jgi:hypothetical protein
MAQCKLATVVVVGLLVVVATTSPLAISQTLPPAARTSEATPPTEADGFKIQAAVAPAILTKWKPVEKDGMSVLVRPQIKSTFASEDTSIVAIR